VFQSNVEDGARNLPAAVLYAVEQGLDAEKALAALTLNAAQAFKIDDRVGSIEPGKDADLAIFNGHPFKDAGQVVGVVVGGKEVTQ
jgi:imidazolonepropionase-like amidohydrolase